MRNMRYLKFHLIIPVIMLIGLFLFSSVVQATPSNPVPVIGGTWADYRVPVNIDMDTFGWIDSYQKVNDIKSKIDTLHLRGIKYAAYFNWGIIETDIDYDMTLQDPQGNLMYPNLDQGRKILLDGSNAADTQFSILSSAYKNYLIRAGKLAIDAGADIIWYDVAAIFTDDFNQDGINNFISFLSNNYTVDELESWGMTNPDGSLKDFDDFLISYGYDNNTINSSEVLTAQPYWQAWLRFLGQEERNFALTLSTELKAYALNNYSRELLLSGNRPFLKQWDTLDIWDFPSQETLNYDELDYPNVKIFPFLRLGPSVNNLFWNLNKSYTDGDKPQLYMAESLAAGGMWQVWGKTVDETLKPFYNVLQSYPGLFPANNVGGGVTDTVYDVAVWDIPLSSKGQGRNFDTKYRGTAQLLTDLNISYVLAGKPGPDAMVPPNYNLSPEVIAGYKVLVLPERDQLTEELAGILKNYVNQGGKLIAFGASSTTSLEDILGVGSWNQPPGASGKAISLGINVDEYLTDDLSARENKRLSVSTILTGESITGTVQLPELEGKVNAFPYKAPDGSLIIQMINYDINAETSMVTPVTAGQTVEVTVPAGFASPSVQWLTPEGVTPVTITDYSINNGKMTITLPNWHIWGILIIGSSIEPAVEEPNRAPMSRANDVFSYMFWNRDENGNPTNDLTIEYEARDENGLAKVDLWSRYSLDGQDYGDWEIVKTVDFSDNPEPIYESPEGSSFSFVPTTDGYYQFYTMATDTLGMAEIKSTAVESTRGFDSQISPPIDYRKFSVWAYDSLSGQLVEHPNLEYGVWQNEVNQPVIKWEYPDTLSPIYDFKVYRNGVEVGRDPNNQTIFEFSSPVNLGSRETIAVKPRESNGNFPTGDSFCSFVFKYGPLPVQDVQNISVLPGDRKITVNWTPPADDSYNKARIYWRELGIGPWLGGDNALVNTFDIIGLNNGTPYEIIVVSVDAADVEGNERPLDNSGLGYVPITGSASPVFTDIGTNTAQTVAEGGSLSALTATDADGDALNYTIMSGILPAGVTLNDDGTFTGTVGDTAAETNDGSYTVSIQVADGHGGTASTTLVITVIPEAVSTITAVPIVQVGVNPDYGDSAGVFIGIDDILDQGSLIENPTIAEYQIEISYYPTMVTILDVVDEWHLGQFNQSIVPGPDTDKVIVSCSEINGTSDFNKLFFIPIALRGTALDLTSLQVNYILVKDASHNPISIDTQASLEFQRGKISNGEGAEPSIEDAIAGLQYLAGLRSAGLGLDQVNPVNMASVIEPDTEATIMKLSIKNIIALMQYLVHSRDSYFMFDN